MQLHICSGRMDFGSNLSGLAHFSSIQCQYCNMLWCKLVNLGVNKKNTRIGYCSIESSTNSGSGHWTALFIVPDHRKKMQQRNMGQLSFQVTIIPFLIILEFGQKMTMRFILFLFLASCSDCMFLLKLKQKS